jgi:signal transduction histidine kinase/DNA-binding response OmpR family regulator
MIFSFVALSYCSPEKNQYAYMLEGYDKDWNYVGNQTRATYTNLPAGTYTFRVKASNNDGIWSEEEATITIVVPPPFWWTWYAKLFYLLLIVFLIWYYVHVRLKRAEKRHKYEMQRLQEQKEKEAREARLNFFTMVAHEIRTPVSLIIGPLEKIKTDNEELRIIDRNAHRLLELVNQLLDFRKAEQHMIVSDFKPRNINELLHAVCERFEPTFLQNGRQFKVNYPDEHFTAIVDGEAITKVVSNLLTNANKYSKKSVMVSCVVESDEEHFRIIVSDDGVGIREEDRQHIFEPFFQAQDNKPGTGIGLNIVKHIVDLHHGTINVDSEVGQGTTFTITLPVSQVISPTTQEANPIQEVQPAPDANVSSTPQPSTSQSLLIVDDSDDMLEFLSSNFCQQYQVTTAHDGIEALDLLSKHEYDLIISDWMMPRMDGAEFCKQVRNNPLTSHIPLILLTAKTDEQSKVEGMDIGADAYIEKPFSLQYLEACIRNIITMRRKLIEKFSSEPTSPITEIASNPTDDKFLKQMTQIIEENIANSDLSVNLLAEQLGISRSGLFAKIKTLADVTPNEMIQIIRLKRAAQLLQEGKYLISEVGYMVGFSNPSYFTKCFQKQFGIKPGDYIKK